VLHRVVFKRRTSNDTVM